MGKAPAFLIYSSIVADWRQLLGNAYVIDDERDVRQRGLTRIYCLARANLEKKVYAESLRSLCFYRLHLIHTAIDKQLDSCDVAAVVRRQEDDGLRDLVGGAEAAHRHDGVEILQTLLSSLAAADELTQPLGIDGTGTDGIHADVARLEVCGPGAGEGTDGSFGRGIDTVYGQPPAADHRRVQDDGRAIGQQRKSLLYREEQTLYVATEDAVEVLFVDGSKCCVFGDSGVGEDDVEFALFALDLFEETVQISHVRDVSLDSGYIRADLLDRGIELRLCPARDKDISSLLHEALGRSQSDAAVTACDECNFVVKLSHGLLPL